MARMKFLCDEERCIECNACVTACKNEHEVPWGVNRRRVVTIDDGHPGEKSISVACMHCSDARAPRFVPSTVFIQRTMGWFFTTKIFVSDAATAFTLAPSERRNTRKTARSAPAEKWINVPSALGVPKKTIRKRNWKNTAVTVWRKVSYHCARKCVRPKPCWRAMAILLPTFSGNVWCAVLEILPIGIRIPHRVAPGGGGWPTRNSVTI